MLYYYALLYYNINLKQIKTMKKIHLISTLIGLLVFSTISKADLKVVTSIKPIHSLASYIMDGVGSPGLIVDGYNSPHSFQLKPSHAKMLEQADIIFWIGEDLENFLEKPLATIAKKADKIELLEIKDKESITELVESIALCMITFNGFAISESLFICSILKLWFSSKHPNTTPSNPKLLQNSISLIIILISSSEYSKDGCFGLIITLMGIFKTEKAFLIKSLEGVKPSKSSRPQSSILLAPFFSAFIASSNESTQTSLMICI